MWQTTQVSVVETFARSAVALRNDSACVWSWQSAHSRLVPSGSLPEFSIENGDSGSWHDEHPTPSWDPVNTKIGSCS